MAVSKLAALCLFVALILTCVRADASTPDEVIGSDAAYKIKLDQLNSKIRYLESRINEQIQELKSKDDLIVEKENNIQAKTSSIESLQTQISFLIESLHTQISSLQKEGSLDAAEEVVKAYAHAGELEKQINKLKKDLKTQEREKKALSAQANEAEKKIDELNAKIGNINEEQNSQIHKTERALKMAEAKFDATSKTKELMEVHDSWLPPWLARHLVHWQMQWNESGKPFMDLMIQKAWENNAQVEEWANTHMETVKTKWIPAMKEQLLAIPHIVRPQEFVDLYYQEVKKHSMPRIDLVASAIKPHVDKVRTALKPYTKKAVHAYGKFLESATTYHHQMQGTIHKMLEKHELRRPLATKELVWFLAWEKNAQVHEWAKLHVETFKTKWMPAMKEQWLAIILHLEPHFQLLTTKAIEAYEVSKTTITPHIVRAQEFVDPYYQEVKKHSKPRIDHVASVTKPHVDKVRTALKPYTKKAVHAYGKFLESATTYHHQMQGTVHEMLKKHELTRPLVTKELVWFLASALLALPIIFLSRICSAIFCKKSKKPVRNAHTSHLRRKAKRGHPDK